MSNSMQTNFQRNLKALSDKYPSLYQKLANFQPTGRYVVTTSAHKMGYPNLLDKSKNRLFYNNFSPYDDAVKQIKEKNFHINGLTFFLGMGLGYHLAAFTDNFEVPMNGKIFIIEPDLEAFYYAMNVADFATTISDNRVVLFVDEPVNTFFTILHNNLIDSDTKYYIKASNIIELPQAYVSNKDYYLSCIEQIKRNFREILLHFGNDPEDSLIGINHTFKNIDEIIKYPGIHNYIDAFKGKVGVVVATGPSLRKNVHLLKDIQDQVVIASVDASVNILKEYGIKPHFVTSLERVIETSKLFDSYKGSDTDDVYLAACPVLHPETYKNYDGERLVVYRAFATFTWIDIEKGMMAIGPSSANMAFALLTMMGCSTIVIIGQDLAYGEDATVTHASGTTYGDKQKWYQNLERIPVKGNCTDIVYTNNVWERFINHYEIDISQYKGTVINATEGGAYLVGTQVMPLQEVIDKVVSKYEPFYPLQVMKKRFNRPTNDVVIQTYEKELHIVEDGIDYCKNLQKRYTGIIENGKLFEENIAKKFYSNEEYDINWARELYDGCLQTMISSFSESRFYLIAMHYVQPIVVKTFIDLYGISNEMPNSIERNSREILLATRMADTLNQLLDKLLLILEDCRDHMLVEYENLSGHKYQRRSLEDLVASNDPLTPTWLIPNAKTVASFDMFAEKARTELAIRYNITENGANDGKPEPFGHFATTNFTVKQ